MGEADPEDKKAQCLLTRIQIQRFVFSADDLVVTCGDLEDLQNLGVPYYAIGRVANIICSHIYR